MPTEETATATMELSIDGRRFEAKVTVPAGPTSPSRLLPVFRALTDAVVGIGVEDARRAGETVSCQRGCAACCRHFVHLAPAEAQGIAAGIRALPPDRRARLEGRFAEVRDRLSREGLLEPLTGAVPLEPESYIQYAVDYFRLRIDCPFLEDEACSIYEDRPLVCRQYLVTSDPARCWNPTQEAVAPVRVPVSVSKALGRLDMSVGPPRRPWVPLILVSEWARDNPDPPPARTGPQLVEQFVRHLAGEPAKNEVIQSPSEAAPRPRT